MASTSTKGKSDSSSSTTVAQKRAAVGAPPVPHPFPADPQGGSNRVVVGGFCRHDGRYGVVQGVSSWDEKSGVPKEVVVRDRNDYSVFIAPYDECEYAAAGQH